MIKMHGALELVYIPCNASAAPKNKARKSLLVLWMHKFAVGTCWIRLAHDHQHVTLLAHCSHHFPLIPFDCQPRRISFETAREIVPVQVHEQIIGWSGGFAGAVIVIIMFFSS